MQKLRSSVAIPFGVRLAIVLFFAAIELACRAFQIVRLVAFPGGGDIRTTPPQRSAPAVRAG